MFIDSQTQIIVLPQTVLFWIRYCMQFFFFSSRRRHTRYWRDWSSDVCSSDLPGAGTAPESRACRRDAWGSPLRRGTPPLRSPPGAATRVPPPSPARLVAAVSRPCVGDRLTGIASADHDVCRGGTMTHSMDAPFPPPPSTGAGATSATSTTTTTTSTGSPSTTDVAKDEARNVGQTAAQAGSQVASTAADQAREVAHETQRQAQDLLHQGRQQLRHQTVAQQQKAASGLTSLAQELRGLADGSSQGAPGPARDLLQQASSYVEQFADRLQNREPADLLDDVRAFARRRPGTFLLGAALAGVLAGRLTSGVKAAHRDRKSTRL